MRKARRSTSTSCWRSASPPPHRGSSAAVTAVIAAAGSGERLGAGGPKAFVAVAGRPMVEWSIDAFRAAGSVGPIVVACPPGHAYREEGGAATVPRADGLTVIEGGATRAASVANALRAVDAELVAIHDAARPLVTAALIEAVVEALRADPEADGAIAATPLTDTIKRVGPAPSPGGERATVVAETLDRDILWAAQTPQVFRTAALRRALGGDSAHIAAATDEAMLVEAAGGRVLVHPPPAPNLKVTTPFDLRVAELLLAGGAQGSSGEGHGPSG